MSSNLIDPKFIIKICYNGHFRKRLTKKLNFNGLLLLLKELFLVDISTHGQLKYGIKYWDSDGDMITVLNDRDIQLAYELLPTGKALKMKIFELPCTEFVECDFTRLKKFDSETDVDLIDLHSDDIDDITMFAETTSNLNNQTLKNQRTGPIAASGNEFILDFGEYEKQYPICDRHCPNINPNECNKWKKPAGDLHLMPESCSSSIIKTSERPFTDESLFIPKANTESQETTQVARKSIIKKSTLLHSGGKSMSVSWPPRERRVTFELEQDLVQQNPKIRHQQFRGQMHASSNKRSMKKAQTGLCVSEDPRNCTSTTFRLY